MSNQKKQNHFSNADRWREYERRKASLPPMPPDEYERAVAEIAQEAGV